GLQRFGHFVQIAGILLHYSHSEPWSRKFNRLYFSVDTLFIECIVGMGIPEFRSHPQIARNDPGNLLPVLPVGNVYMIEIFVSPCLCIDEGVPFGKNTTI